ncbi:MAG: molybdenum cofactor guanylyltransferase [Cyanobium sp. NAT70]|nr:molybdenum cofactor guanylyltransferase [Cyanobium sp. NAT70]
MTLRACVLCGGQSRRMGADKALLHHPDGGVWLTVVVDLLCSLSLSVVVVSGHPSHSELLTNHVDVVVVDEPPPWQGPLRALSHVFAEEPGHPLLVLPVDMPRLTQSVLQQLIDQWCLLPHLAAIAHDGDRHQSLLGIFPSGPPFQDQLIQQLAQGNRRWQTWVSSVPHRSVRLPAEALFNANCPEDLASLNS